jgi:benzoate membrane transport protein
LSSPVERLYATPAAAVLAALLIALAHRGEATVPGGLTPQALLVAPSFSLSATISLALPLFIVTMASQNIPGLAVLTASGYRPNPSLLISVTGFFSLLTAPFGGHALNLAAIIAALCASPDAHPDPGKRWIAAASAGGTYVVFGLLAGAMTSVVAGSPILVEAVAGLALLGAFGSAMGAALADAEAREAALATFLATASGVSFFGVGGAFWGLAAGGAILALNRAGARLRRPAPAS